MDMLIDKLSSIVDYYIGVWFCKTHNNTKTVAKLLQLKRTLNNVKKIYIDTTSECLREQLILDELRQLQLLSGGISNYLRYNPEICRNEHTRNVRNAISIINRIEHLLILS